MIASAPAFTLWRRIDEAIAPRPIACSRAALSCLVTAFATFPPHDASQQGVCLVSQASLRRLCVLVGALALLVVLPLRASAQSNMDFALGYAVMHDSDAETNFPLGWFASIGAPMSPRWGIAGDISGSYKTIEVA